MLTTAKEHAELKLKDEMNCHKQLVRRKISLCSQRQQQKDSVEQYIAECCQQLKGVEKMPSSSSSKPWSFEQAMCINGYWLQIGQKLHSAFAATESAKEQLQSCLQQEQELLNRLHKPVVDGLQQSLLFLQSNAEQLAPGKPQQEQRHAEMLMR